MILIVDDHLDNCRPLMILLKLEGIEVVCIDDARAALAAVRALKPALVVLDQSMPGVSGTDILAAMRGAPELAAIPAIFYTAVDNGQDEARRLGALDWIMKGSTDWEVLRRRIVESYRARTNGDGAVA